MNSAISNLSNQLSRISKLKTDVSAATTRSREHKVNAAFQTLGIEKFNYLQNAKTQDAKNKALSRAAKTLASKLKTYEKRQIALEKKELNNLKREVIQKAKKNISDAKFKLTNPQTGESIGVNNRTQNQLYQRGLLPERGDINNMNLQELKNANELMNIPIEDRANKLVYEETMEFLKERYFLGLEGEPGIQERLEKIAQTMSGDYAKFKDFLEDVTSSSFKGGYGDTKEMLKNNSNANISDVMYDRLSRIESDLGLNNKAS